MPCRSQWQPSPYKPPNAPISNPETPETRFPSAGKSWLFWVLIAALAPPVSFFIAKQALGGSSDTINKITVWYFGGFAPLIIVAIGFLLYRSLAKNSLFSSLSTNSIIVIYTIYAFVFLALSFIAIQIALY